MDELGMIRVDDVISKGLSEDIDDWVTELGNKMRSGIDEVHKAVKSVNPVLEVF